MSVYHVVYHFYEYVLMHTLDISEAIALIHISILQRQDFYPKTFIILIACQQDQ
ncbi:hypothetical protein H6G08_10085 [Calothrix anomala FACHB-343]|uniref:Uncharacterized protein n=2 Tax=Calothrix TaxID=1186 RepID=A0ABR8AAY3_9CYAN|nr:hypothetical protein [Calothrix parietina FACHB-288]MBD2224849.1 hypothetical protein [Calothrix anomala FACHB-343]